MRRPSTAGLLSKLAQLDKQRNTVDYEFAATLHELHSIVKTDVKFITLINQSLKIHGKTLNMWLRTAKFYGKFTKKDWQKLGGREGLQKLAYLGLAQRRKVMKTAYKKVNGNKMPLSSTAIQNIITGFGFRTKTPGQGRSQQTEVERKLLLCQNWLDILYKDFYLTAPPADVKKAMKRTQLALAMRQLRKRSS